MFADFQRRSIAEEEKEASPLDPPSQRLRRLHVDSFDEEEKQTPYGMFENFASGLVLCFDNFFSMRYYQSIKRNKSRKFKNDQIRKWY